MFYARYVDDTLLIIKKKYISYILNQFNSFDKNLKFTIGAFENCNPHFLDIEVCPNLIFIINMPKLVNMYTLTPMHYGDGKLLESVH